MHPRILIVDDDRAVRTALRVNLSRNHYEVSSATNADEALKMMSDSAFDLVISDVRMPGGSGIALLKEIKKRWPEIAVIIMTGFGSVEDAVQAMKEGASNYLIKPVSKDSLLVLLERTFKEKRRDSELIELRDKVKRRYGFENLIGTNQKMRAVYDLAHQVADTSATVLLEGPTGTGKEVLAHAIHYSSRRRNAPFIRVNCAALPESLLESELFGHEKGAFSGAIRQHRGRFELANGGSILLDEIGEISAAMQVKLLRVLEEGEFQRVGSMDTIKVDVRIIAATNRHLKAEVEAGRFREDLYYRLNVFAIKLPPLRERLDDIPLLAEHFLKIYARKNQKKIQKIAPEVLHELSRYEWPGNVRELEHVIERAVIMTSGKEIREIELPNRPARRPPMPQRSLKEALLACEKETICNALRASNGVQAKAAELLHISRSNLNYRLKKLKIDVKEVMRT